MALVCDWSGVGDYRDLRRFGDCVERMEIMTTFTIPNVPAAALAVLAEKLATSGLSVSQIALNDEDIQGHGCDVEARYDPLHLDLTFIIRKSPPFFAGKVQSVICERVAEVLTGLPKGAA